jgi:hypothetical protein
VTLLCSAIVEMSNGSLFCSSAVADEDPATNEDPATCDCAGTLLAPALASIVTPAPAADVVLEPTSPAVVSVAESTGAAAEELAAAWGALAGALPPAMTVTAWVWRVEGGLIEPIAGMSWKGAAWGADMGNALPGQLHAQLHRLAAACAAVPLLPFPATTVTALPGAETVVDPARPPCVRAAELADWADVEDVGRPGAIAAAAPVAVLLFATTVIALAIPAAAEVELVASPATIEVAFPLSATTVIAPPATEAEVELVASPAAREVAFPLPATTVIAPAAAEAVEVELAPPFPASTVTALPALLVVVTATRPSWVSPDVFIDLAAEAVAFAEFSCAPPVPPEAMTVIAAAADVPAIVEFPAADVIAATVLFAAEVVLAATVVLAAADVLAAAVDSTLLFCVEPSSERSSEGSATIVCSELVHTQRKLRTTCLPCRLMRWRRLSVLRDQHSG